MHITILFIDVHNYLTLKYINHLQYKNFFSQLLLRKFESSEHIESATTVPLLEWVYLHPSFLVIDILRLSFGDILSTSLIYNLRQYFLYFSSLELIIRA